jgi:energy-coupling factor transporter ATP-binding protein EcfA2
MGRNGTGKTKLACFICSVIKPTQVEICVDGIPYDATTQNRLRLRVGLIFQNPDNNR